jgi:signal transduction histidine kinase/DNA-binding NarL/FixJ family response regulator
MSQPENERQASETRMRRLELLGLANGGLALAALVAFVSSFPLAPSPLRLTALSLLAGCIGVALWLRRRFWSALDGELRRRKRAEQEARAADRAKGQFLANVSHEIRTPMHGVLGMADLLLKSELSSSQREQVEAVRTSAEALLALINDILDLSRIEAGRLELRLRDFHLREIVGDVVRLLTPQAAERAVELSLHIAPDLPNDLHGDPVRLRQVLINLVGNAIRFTRKGSVTVTCDLLDEEEVPVIRCQVRDTGAGIRPEVQGRLFQPFTQSDSASSRQLGGTGLGLVISKSIVELMGGAIGFESAHGAGSTFWFLVPLVRAQAAIPVAPPTVPDTAREAGRRAARRHIRVLVVDDHPVNRSLAVAQLQDLGYRVDAADGGEAALRLLAEGSYDAVLLDCAMPELDGYETSRRLRRMEGGGRRVPVIALTAHVMEGERERCLDAGMDDFLAKPYQVTDLVTRLDRWVGIEMPAPDSDAGRIAARLTDLQRLGKTTGEDVVDQVVQAFLQRGAEDLDAMEKALACEDGKVFAAATHSLGGSSGILGAVELARRCAELEAFARHGDLAACASPLLAVQQEFREVAGRLAP